VDVGWYAVRTRTVVVDGRAGNSWSGLECWGWEAMVKVYGVAVAMPQG
jgi:hypothetical protein